MALPAIIIDSREQTPFSFENIPVQYGTLSAGDYSLAGFTDLIAIERKSLQDMVQCCGKERDRFKSCLFRLRSYKCKAVIIEATLGQIESGKWYGDLKPSHVLGSINSWRARYGIEFIYAGTPELASQECKRLMFKFYDYLKETVMRFK